MGNRIGGPGSLAGKRALVIGASNGIGLASAEALLADGADLLICARNPERLEKAATGLREAIPDAQGSLATMTCDALVGAQVRAAVEAAAGEAGLDIAVGVPGGGNFCPVLGYDDDTFSSEVDANLRPIFLLIKYAGLAMIQNGGGSIVVVSSTASILSSPFLAAYCAAKAACDQLVKVAADEVGQHGIRINAVRPGLTRTGASEDMFENRALIDSFIAEQPLDKDGAPEDIARAIRFLAGDEAEWITGQCLSIDGGHTIRKFPWLEDVARGVAGNALFESIERGKLP
ncbi:MAG: short-chain dehydrogenase [Deltaproteobacteria bacterium]|jgi:NAD(P)-dependent dehydrogenase (short-subunit alcohol dehydrogenase family)|nr:short-chain dehydrogenase [Deltaproteobacteria bacterium]